MSDEIEFVKMSEKGQLVVPQNIREGMNLSPGERFVAFQLDEGILFKKIEIPEIKINFENLAKNIEKQFKKNKINKKDVKEAIKWARKR